ncbi:MAG: AzlD domain-containing protein [Anaerolineae bacterium]|nr:AzlD domain-containing protein [Anaerolineae bacterium]
MWLWLTLFIVGGLTYLQRVFFVGFDDSLPPATRLRHGLRFVPVSVLVALIVPELLVVEDAIVVAPGNIRLLAGLVAIATAWHTRSILWTLVAGMVTLLLLQLIASLQLAG